MREQGYRDYDPKISLSLEKKAFRESAAVYPRYLYLTGTYPKRSEAHVAALFNPITYKGEKFEGCSRAGEATAERRDPQGAEVVKQQQTPPLTQDEQADPRWKPLVTTFRKCMTSEGFKNESLFAPGQIAIEKILTKVTADLDDQALEALLADERIVFEAMSKCEPDWKEFNRIRGLVLVQRAP